MDERSRLPPVRRYWFADRRALDAVAAAIDPPQWPARPVPTLVFAADADTRGRIDAMFREDDKTALGAGGNRAALEHALTGEAARYVQLVRHSVVDFGPALDLMLGQMQQSPAAAVSGRMMRIGRCRTVLDTELAPEFHWFETELLRRIVQDEAGYAPEEIAARALETATETRALPLVVGAWFAPEEAPAAPEEEMRARFARLQAERDRLVFDARSLRVRQRRLKAKLESEANRRSGRHGNLWRRAGAAFAGFFGRSR